MGLWTNAIKKCRAFLYRNIKQPYGKMKFFSYYKKRNSNSVPIIIDVGCGNDSVKYVEKAWEKYCYIGIDVGDYNISDDSREKMSEYYVVAPEEFHTKILDFEGMADIVISSHNVEHCDKPREVVDSMCKCLKKGGGLYISYPCEESVDFPSRRGTLNFYDDKTHQWLPQEKIVHKILRQNNIKIIKYVKNNKPIILRIIGFLNEGKSRKEHVVLNGTWEYYGFESITWGIKE